MVKFSILNREKTNPNPTQHKKKVNFLIIKHEKSNPNPVQYKKWSIFGFLIAKNQILILSNMKIGQVFDFESRKIES
jgi:hypothetical protein